MGAMRPPLPRLAPLAALLWGWLVLLGGMLAHASAAAQAPSLTTDPSARESAVRLSASVLRIEAPQPGGGFSLGSGVLVAPGLVVTNCHVTRQSETLRVVRGGVRWPVTAQRADMAHDLCLLHAPGVQAAVVPLADSDAHALVIGQQVTALGYSGGMDLQHSIGAVVDLHRLDGGQVVQTSNGFNSGASGGGLFDAEGRLVGILTFRLRGGDQHYFAAPALWVRQLLATARQEGLPAVAALDPAALPFWQVPGDRQPRFLRAARMVHEQRWHDLAGLAQGWLQDDGHDGEPWYLLGLALHQLDQPAAARQALDCAIRLQPQRTLDAAGPVARRVAVGHNMPVSGVAPIPLVNLPASPSTHLPATPLTDLSIDTCPT